MLVFCECKGWPIFEARLSVEWQFNDAFYSRGNEYIPAIFTEMVTLGSKVTLSGDRIIFRI